MRRGNVEIHCRQTARGVRNKASEDHTVADAAQLGQRFEFATFRSIADDEETCLRPLRCKKGEGFHQHIDSLNWVEACYSAENEAVRWEAQLFTGYLLALYEEQPHPFIVSSIHDDFSATRRLKLKLLSLSRLTRGHVDDGIRRACQPLFHLRV